MAGVEVEGHERASALPLRAVRKVGKFLRESQCRSAGVKDMFVTLLHFCRGDARRVHSRVLEAAALLRVLAAYITPHVRGARLAAFLGGYIGSEDAFSEDVLGNVLEAE